MRARGRPALRRCSLCAGVLLVRRGCATERRGCACATRCSRGRPASSVRGAALRACRAVARAAHLSLTLALPLRLATAVACPVHPVGGTCGGHGACLDMARWAELSRENGNNPNWRYTEAWDARQLRGCFCEREVYRGPYNGDIFDHAGFDCGRRESRAAVCPLPHVHHSCAAPQATARGETTP